MLKYLVEIHDVDYTDDLATTLAEHVAELFAYDGNTDVAVEVTLVEES